MLVPSDVSHPLDELKRWGYSLHGLLSATDPRTVQMGSYTHGFGDDQTFSAELGNSYARMFDRLRVPQGFGEWPVGCVHLLQLIDPPEVGLTPEQLDAEQADGRSWQDYALINGVGQMLFGFELDGWVCIDGEGARWHIKSVGAQLHLGQYNPGAMMEVRLEVRPFGYLDAEPAIPVLLEFDLVDLGQVPANPSIAFPGMPLVSVITAISPQGRDVIVALMAGNDQVLGRERRLPLGWLRFTLGGDGPNFDLAGEVLYTREEALGVVAEDRQENQWRSVSIDPVLSTELVDLGGGLRRLVATPTGAMDGTEGVFVGAAQVGHEHYYRTHTGRVCQVSYASDGTLTTITADVEARIDVDWNTPTLDSVSGSLWADQGSSAVNGGTLTATHTRTGTDKTHVSITTRRNGIEVERAEWLSLRELSGSYTNSWVPGNVGSAAHWGVEPPTLTITLDSDAAAFKAAWQQSLSINTEERWAWASSVVDYGYILPSQRDGATGLTSFMYCVEMTQEVTGVGRPVRWVGYRVAPCANHVLGFSWFQLPEWVSNPNNPWTPVYMKWHRYAATEGDWASEDWSSGPLNQDAYIPAYNPKTGEIVLPEGTSRIAGYFI